MRLFELMNAPEAFQQLLDYLLKSLHFYRAYLIDVAIYSKSLKEEVLHLYVMFGSISDHLLWLIILKREFVKSRVELLQQMFSSTGLPINLRGLQAMNGILVPCSAIELRSFLGLSKYYHCLIHDFARTSAAPFVYTEKNTRLQ